MLQALLAISLSKVVARTRYQAQRSRWCTLIAQLQSPTPLWRSTSSEQELFFFLFPPHEEGFFVQFFRDEAVYHLCDGRLHQMEELSLTFSSSSHEEGFVHFFRDEAAVTTPLWRSTSSECKSYLFPSFFPPLTRRVFFVQFFRDEAAVTTPLWRSTSPKWKNTLSHSFSSLLSWGGFLSNF